MTVQRLTRRTNLRKNSLDLDKIFSNPTYDAEGKVVLPTGGATDISSLSDVTATTFQNGELLKFNGSAWINTTIEVADLSDSNTIALLDSPVLTGTPEAPTQSTLDSSDKLATTQFVQDAIASSGTNALTYQGSVSVSNFATTLQNALKGSFYKISTGGTASDGRVYASGDSVIVNADMSGTFANSKLDKIDNVDPETSDEIVGSHSAQNYTAQNTDSLTTHLDGIDSALASKLDATLINPTVGEFLIYSGSVWVNSAAASTHLSDSSDLARLASPAFTGTPTAPTATAGTNTTQVATTEFVTTAISGVTTGITELVEDTTPQLGGSLDVNGNSITSNANGNIVIDPNGTGTVTLGSDLVPDVADSHTIGSESSRFVTAHTDINGAIRFKAKNDQGTQITKGQAVYIKGVSGTIPTVGLAQANSASTMPAFGLALETANDQAEIQVVTFGNLSNYDTTTYNLAANQTIYVSDTVAGGLTNTAPSGESNLIQNIGRVVRANGSSGILKVGGAGRSNATPNLDDGKIFLGDSNNQAVSTALSSINLSSFNDDLATSYQPLDAALTSISGLTTSADKLIYTTGPDTYAITDLTAAGRALLDDADASAQRTTLGLGSAATSQTSDFLAATSTVSDLSDVSVSFLSNGQVLSYNSTSGDWENTTPATGVTDLDGLTDVTLTSATSGDIIQHNGSGQFVNVAKSSINLSEFNDDLSYQASDAALTSIAGLTTSADNMIYTTGADTYATASITSAGRAILDDADATAQRATLGLGTAATSASTDFLASTATIDDLSDVTFANLANGEVLTYNSTSGDWENATLTIPQSNPNIYVSTSTSYAPSAADAPNLLAWYGGSNTTTFTVTLPDILSVLTGTGATNTVVESFTMWVGRGYDGDITLSSTNGIDGLGGTISYASTLTVPAGTWVKIVGWKTSSSNARYLVEVPYEAPVDSVNGATGVVTIGADDIVSGLTPVNYAAASTETVKIHLSAIDTALGSVATSQASETTAGIIEIATNTEAGAGTATDKALVPSNVSSLSLTSSQVSGLATVATSGAYSDLSGTPTLGTAASFDVGTTASDVVQLDASARLPAVDGSQLTNLPSGGISNLIEDTTPQLGGNLDPNGNAISGALVPSAANTYALGSATAEWSDLFLGDGSVINFGLDQDIQLSHDPDRGLVLKKAPGSAFYPRLILQNEDSGTLSHGELMFESLSTTPANNDFISRILARAKNSAASGFDYTKLISRIGDVTDGTEAGRMLIQVATGGTVAGNPGTTALELFGDSSGEITVKIAEHDGASSGLMLGSTLLTSTASELNLLDGGATVGSSVTITDTDGIILNDGGITKLVPALDLKTYAGGGGGGGTSYTYSAISTTTTAQAWYHYSVDTSSGAVTLNLPALSSVTDGDEIRVKLRVAGNTLTVDANSTETIDGQQTVALATQWQSLTFVAGSTEWEII